MLSFYHQLKEVVYAFFILSQMLDRPKFLWYDEIRNRVQYKRPFGASTLTDQCNSRFPSRGLARLGSNPSEQLTQGWVIFYG